MYLENGLSETGAVNTVAENAGVNVTVFTAIR